MRTIMNKTLLTTGILALALAATGFAADYTVKRLVAPSNFHGVHGLRFDKDGNLYAASVIGQTIYKIDMKTKKVTPFIGPRDGMADDLAVAPDGTWAWTSIEDGIFHMRTPDGKIRHLMDNQKGVNAVSFTPDGKRLFVSLVFYGDALFEVDFKGNKPPRQILKDIGGLNGFDIGADGMIYGPLWFRNKIVKIDPDKGTITTIAEGFKTPAALKLDGKGNAYIPDTGAQELVRVDLKTGKRTLVVKMRSDLDNLAIDSRGHVFVSLSHLNAIDEVDPATGKVTEFIPAGALTSTAGLAVTTEGGRDTLFVGDVFGGVRKVNGDTGAVTETPVEIFQPSHVSVSAKHYIAVSQLGGVIQSYDRATNKKVDEWTGFKGPGDVLEAPNGDLIVAESGTGNLVQVSGSGKTATRKNIATGLGGPLGLAWAGTDAVYVSESTSGQITRVNLKSGSKTVVASKLQQPEGIAVESEGTICVVEVAAKQVSRIRPKDGAKTLVTDKVPLGLSNGPSLYRGIAASTSTHAIYVASDIENSIYKIALK
jgi:sugar lactone lactonase YvrE